MQGPKVRVVQAPLMIDTFEALGTNAVPMPFTELYSALETGAMEGQDNPVVAFETNKLYEVQKYLPPTRHVDTPLIVLIGRKAWDQLSQDERRIVDYAAAEVRDKYTRDLGEGLVKEIHAEIQKVRGTSGTAVSTRRRTNTRPRARAARCDSACAQPAQGGWRNASTR